MKALVVGGSVRRPASPWMPVGSGRTGFCASAACVTDPLYGRGAAPAVGDAHTTDEVLSRHPCVGQEQNRQAAALADAHVRPWLDHAVHTDDERITLWNRTVHATPLPDSRSASNSSGYSGRTPPGLDRAPCSRPAPPHRAPPHRAPPPRRATLSPTEPPHAPSTPRANGGHNAPPTPVRLAYPGACDSAGKALVPKPYRALRQGDIDILITDHATLTNDDLAQNDVSFTAAAAKGFAGLGRAAAGRQPGESA